MPDRHAVMTEILRVLRPGGVVGIAVWSNGTPPEPFVLRSYSSSTQHPRAVSQCV